MAAVGLAYVSPRNSAEDATTTGSGKRRRTARGTTMSTVLR
ncbi:Uncharacterised protein [Kocuria rosea]|nr:Uncharacterised protein [Kocuria rosea]